MYQEMIVADLVKDVQMLQITNKGQSLRIRPNNRIEGEYFCTTRDTFTMTDRTMVSLPTPERVVEFINKFLNGEVE